MTNILGYSSCVAAVAVLLLGAVAPIAAQQHEHTTGELVPGEEGDFTIVTETKIAGITLAPGRYYVDHRVEGTVTPRRVVGHYVHFTQMAPEVHLRRRSARNAIGDYVVAHPGEIECTVEPLAKEARKTIITTTMVDGVPHITRIEIAGEAVAHVFWSSEPNVPTRVGE